MKISADSGLKVLTRDGHVCRVMDDWLRWGIRLDRQVEGEGRHDQGGQAPHHHHHTLSWHGGVAGLGPELE